VDQVVELERVDLAAVKPGEAVAHVLEQVPQLLLVVGADQRTSRATPRSLSGHGFALPTNAHATRR
jgi:hypothetical protein